MIPADHISFNDDGTAWWIVKPVHRMGVTNTVGDDYYDPSWFMSLDRPCDTCDGDMIDGGHDAAVFYAYSGKITPCPDCIDGRHTFTIEVAWQTEVDAYESQTYRVSVIPGMVLPIVRGVCPDPTNAEYRRAHIHVSTDESPQPVFGMCEADSDLIFGSPWKSKNLLTLPPAAAPGQWAVKLKVAQ